MKKILILFVLFANKNLFAQLIPKQDLIDDLTFLNNAFKKGHPANLKKESAVNFSQKISAFEQELPDSITKEIFEMSVRKALIKIGCTHTAVVGFKDANNKQKIEENLFPFYIFCDGNKLFIREKVTDSIITQITKGNEIVSINNFTSTTIINELLNFRAVDGNNNKDFNIQIINNLFREMFYKYFGNSTKFTIQYLDKNNNLKSETLNGVKQKNISIPIPNAIFKEKDNYFSLKDSSIGILTLANFNGKCKSFFKSVFNYLQQHPTINLVVDVRNNLGGDRTNAENLISYFITKECSYTTIRPQHTLRPYFNGSQKIKYYTSYIYDIRHFFNRPKTTLGRTFKEKIHPNNSHYTKPVFILTNGYTASSASLFATYLRHHTNNTIIIGQETAGGEYSNNGGVYPKIILPKSGLQISTPVYFLKYDFEEKTGNGIVPDYRIDYNVNNYLVKDLELEKAIQLIKIKN